MVAVLPVLTDEELLYTLETQLPSLLDRHPEFQARAYTAFLHMLARREEVAAIMEELRALHGKVDVFQVETRQRFEQVDQRFDEADRRRNEAVATLHGKVDVFQVETRQRFEQVDQRFEQVDKRFDEADRRLNEAVVTLQKSIDRLGSRWGIRIESVFRQTVYELLAKSFGVQVERRVLAGEEFDLVIFDGQHILVEIASSAGPSIQERLERKRRLYTESTGVAPARVLLATASIHSRRALLLREAGFEVIEPEEETLDDTPR